MQPIAAVSDDEEEDSELDACEARNKAPVYKLPSDSEAEGNDDASDDDSDRSMGNEDENDTAVLAHPHARAHLTMDLMTCVIPSQPPSSYHPTHELPFADLLCTNDLLECFCKGQCEYLKASCRDFPA